MKTVSSHRAFSYIHDVRPFIDNDTLTITHMHMNTFTKGLTVNMVGLLYKLKQVSKSDGRTETWISHLAPRSECQM